MPVNNLIQKFEILHQLNQEFIPREQAVLNYLSSAPQDIDNAQIVGLLTLVKSITSLRQLAHLQLRDTMLELQDSIRVSHLSKPLSSPSAAQEEAIISTQSSSQESDLRTPIESSKSLELPEPSPLEEPSDNAHVIEAARFAVDEQSELETRAIGSSLDDQSQGMTPVDTDDRHLRDASDQDAEPPTPDEPLESHEPFDPFDAPTRIEISPYAEKSFDLGFLDETPPSPQEPTVGGVEEDELSTGDGSSIIDNQNVDEHPHESSADEELAALQREVASITQPIFGQSVFEGNAQAPPVSSLLPPSMIPEEATPFVDEVVLRSDVVPPLDEDPSSKDSTPHERSSATPSSEDERDREPHTDFSSVFPESAGEAGTATFEAKSLKAAGIFLTPEPNIISQVKANFYASITTPEVSFEGLVHALSEREIFVKSRESLHRGEEVQLSFTLPTSRERIKCIALVREVRSPEEAHQRHLVPGVNLRFLNLRPTQEALINEEVKRQTRS